MKDGFVRVAAGTPAVRVADCAYNTENIIALMREAEEKRVKVLVLPELCVTGYTAADLFLQDTLLAGALSGLAAIKRASVDFPLPFGPVIATKRSFKSRLISDRISVSFPAPTVPESLTRYVMCDSVSMTFPSFRLFRNRRRAGRAGVYRFVRRFLGR